MPRSTSIAKWPTKSYVAEGVREMIRAKQLGPGDLLPTYQELSRTFDVSYVTIKRGLDVLAAEGLITRVPARGTFISKKLARAARPLKRLGIIYPSSRHALFSTPYLNAILRGIMLQSPPHMDLHVFSMREEGLVNAAQIAQDAIDGVILLGVENDDYLRAFSKWGTPGIAVDYCAKATPLDYVACDNQSAAQHLVEHLAKQGHRHALYLAGSPHSVVLNARDSRKVLLNRDSSDVRERYEETLLAMQKCGISMLRKEIGLVPDKWTAGAKAIAAKIVKQQKRPTALIVENDSLMIGHLVDALEQHGLRVPEDISVCAIAGGGGITCRGQVLTCCLFDFVEMGRSAVKMLEARCRATHELPRMSRRIGFTFEAGETTRPATGKRRPQRG